MYVDLESAVDLFYEKLQKLKNETEDVNTDQ